MSKTPPESPQPPSDDLQREYHFNYQQAKPNRFADRNGMPTVKVVVLDEDVAQVFTTSEAVNKALRAIIEAMAKSTGNGAV